MWSDNETSIDYLNYVEVAELICDMVTDNSLLPLSVGVFGGWGVGKSSVLKLVESSLSSRDDTVVIEFDAWLYQGFDEAKAALMSVIASELLEKAPETLKGKAKDLVSRANKLRFLGLGTELGLAAMGVPTFGFISKMLNSAEDIYEGRGDESDVATLREGATAAKGKTDGLFKAKEIKTPPEEITAFKNEFSMMLDAMQKRLVVFVDNLDRCLPENAIKSLEAMRLFLSMPNTAFIIAADVDMIRHAVSVQFKGASDRHVLDYLDKLIQFPVTVPRLGLREVLSFLCMLIASRSNADEKKIEALRTYLIQQIQGSWKEDSKLEREEVVRILAADAVLASQIDTAFRIAPILTYSRSVSGNPRIIKRMMNVVRMRHATAKRRSMELDEAVITKLALFERCTDEAAFTALLDLVNAAPNGRPALFDSKQRDNIQIPEGFDKHKVFVTEWLDLEPTLYDVDLRPAVYLARETLPLQIKSKSLSPEAKKAVAELLKVSSLTSKAAQTSISKIPAEEATEVMNELVNAMRQNSDWSHRRSDLNGPLLLAEQKLETASALDAFLEQIPNKAPWLQHLLKDR
ncbi:NTPase KAP [Rhizobium leguminosarum bv. viciae]|nr:P-loop NTPase fold protein [Rhizobium leguminosarum]NKN01169.1 NTPase KAP [Rhizobium leguminosarum bv. viciae]